MRLAPSVAAGRLFDLTGRTALVTGATGGLGRAIAGAFAAHGARLVLSDREAGGCAAFAVALSAISAQPAMSLAADLAQAADVRHLAEAALAECGRIDVQVCNAGVQGPAGPVDRSTDADWHQVMDINLRAALTLTCRRGRRNADLRRQRN